MMLRIATALNPRPQQIGLTVVMTLICLSATTKGFYRQDSSTGVSYINFKPEAFSYLNITRIVSELIQDGSKCEFACLEITSCFSYNLAAFPDNWGKLLCELLPSDKHREPNELISNPIFHHFSKTTPCFSDPCISNATCVVNYKENDYHCSICPPFYNGKDCSKGPFVGLHCLDIKERGFSRGNGMYWLDPDGGSHFNAFQAYCDMTLHNGGWTMCYTTDEYVRPKSEVTYNAQFPYGSDGYRTDCNNIPFREIIFEDHSTGKKIYFKSRNNQAIKASLNYGKSAYSYGLWDDVGADPAYSYQLLICDDPFYRGFLISAHTGGCFMTCTYWCSDVSASFFHTAFTNSLGQKGGVAFGEKGQEVHDKRRMSIGLR